MNRKPKLPAKLPGFVEGLPSYLQKAAVRGRRLRSEKLAAIDVDDSISNWGGPGSTSDHRLRADTTSDQHLQADIRNSQAKAAKLRAQAHIEAQNAVVAKKLTKYVNKQVKRHLDAGGGTEAIENIVLDMDARGVVTRATFTVPVPPMRQLTPKVFVERLKATVELEIELLQEQL